MLLYHGSMPPIIRLDNVSYAYDSEGRQPVQALDGVSLDIEQGEYVVILGHNGSGKSTLAKHLNALLLPSSGDVWVRGWNTRDLRHTLDIRRTVGHGLPTSRQPDRRHHRRGGRRLRAGKPRRAAPGDPCARGLGARPGGDAAVPHAWPASAFRRPEAAHLHRRRARHAARRAGARRSHGHARPAGAQGGARGRPPPQPRAAA